MSSRDVVFKMVDGYVTDIKVFRSEHYAGMYLIGLLKELGAECPNEWDSWDNFSTMSDRYIYDLADVAEKISDESLTLKWCNAEYVQ
jgi:hypothetical protein